YGHADSKDCFVNGQWGAGWGMWPQKHTLSHPKEHQISNGMQFAHEARDNLRRKGIKAGSSQHEIEMEAMRDFSEEEHFQYPQRYSAYRRDDMKPFPFTKEQQKLNLKKTAQKVEDDPAAYAKKSSAFSFLSQSGAPRSRNWNLQFVQDYAFGAPKTLG
ncbi:hypothetical protein PFISCL1PPCAC_11692, partial [Pristionchus fissidentatus]